MQRERVSILLVDDGENNLLALEALLQDESVELIKASSGEEALEILLTCDFCLALLDVQMPGMDGFELAQYMRGTERTRSIPIIFLTAMATDERRRFRGYETGAVDYLLKPFEPQMLQSKVAVFVELYRQRQDLARQRDELRDSSERLSKALDRLQAHGDNSPLAVVEFEPSLHVLSWSKGAERIFGWTAEEVVGQRAAELHWLPAKVKADFSEWAKKLLEGNEPRLGIVADAFHRDGTKMTCEWYLSSLRDSNGKPVSLNALILDVTERTQAEETQRLLIGELNHRVKNTLATVQAIATQTLRHNRNLEDFAASFAGRLQALARAHSLLSDAVWKGASLADLVSDQLRLGTIDERRMRLSGPRVFLPPQLALHLALILHELATNANKYGALSNARGMIDLKWTIAGEQLEIEWAESGVSGIEAPSKRGFGTTLIEQSVKAEGGSARASYGSDGMSWGLSFRLPRLSSDDNGLPVRDLNNSAEIHSEPKIVTAILAGKKFLIVEDEPLVAIEIENILQDEGANVKIAGSVAAALQNIAQSQFDAALLDGNLQGSPVDEIAAALTRAQIPFAFVSGYGKQNLPSSFASVTVVTKPFLPSELLRATLGLLPARGEVVRLAKTIG